MLLGKWLRPRFPWQKYNSFYSFILASLQPNVNQEAYHKIFQNFPLPFYSFFIAS